MKISTVIFRQIPVLLGLLLMPCHAAWDLAQLYTQTVKQGQPWGYFVTDVNEVNVNITVDKGVATTRVEVAFTPVTSESGTWDSLETNSGFYFEPGTAISELYLWVEGKKVRGELQERGLASAQYESIVQRRQDPALLQTWGNGHYSLSVFPLRKDQTRRIQIDFIQGISSAGIDLPIVFSDMSPYGVVPDASEKVLQNLNITLQALDGQDYTLEWEGLGSFKVNGAPQSHTYNGLRTLGKGVLNRNSSSEIDLWSGRQRDVAFFGTGLELSADNLTLEGEPNEILILVDAPDATGTQFDVARKIALLCLKAYATPGKKINLGFINEAGNLGLVFGDFVTLNHDRLLTVFNALRSFNGSVVATSNQALITLLDQLKADRKTSLILISGQSPRVFEVPYPDQTGNVYMDGIRRQAWMVQYNAFYEALNNQREDLIDDLVENNWVLFGFWQDYWLSGIAQGTGGYNIGNLSGYIYTYQYPYNVAIITETNTADDVWKLPPLFGPGRPDAYTPQNVEVKVTGLKVSDLAINYNYYGYYYPYMMIDDGMVIDGVAPQPAPMPLAKKGQMNSSEVSNIWVSGKYAGSGSIAIEVTGTWGGLGFNKTFRGSLPLLPTNDQNNASGLWAYQKSEDLRTGDYYGTVEQVLSLGMNYHIVNSQVSLLALEPGMTLWDSLPTGENPGNGVTDGVTAEVDANMISGDAMISIYYQQGYDINSLTLEEILDLEVAPIGEAVTTLKPVLQVDLHNGLQVQIGNLIGSEQVDIRVLNIRGIEMANLRGEFSGRFFRASWDNSSAKSGIYIIRAVVDGSVLMKKITLAR